MDLELSTKGSAYDFANLTFLYSGRRVGANWFTLPNAFVADANQTPPDFDANDFVSGTVGHLKNAKGEIFAFPWEAGGMLMAASRGDLIEKAGLKLEMRQQKVLRALPSSNQSGTRSSRRL